MKRLTQTIALAGIASSLLLATVDSMAQEQQQPGQRGQRGQGGQGGQGRGGFDPAQAREMAMERTQETLGMSADEFKAVRPLIENVMTKQTELAAVIRGPGRGGRGGQGGPGGPGGQGGQGGGGRGGFGGAPSPELEALQKAIDSGSAPDIKAKLDAFRAARKAKQDALKEAREKLTKVLTAKQEAQLVMGGGFGGGGFGGGGGSLLD